MSGIDEYANETMMGHCATVAAMAIALDECDVLPKNRYEDALRRLWLRLPDEEALGDAGAAIEQVLDFLTASAGTGCPSDDAVQEREIRAFAKRPTNNDASARPEEASLKALLHAICGAVPRALGRENGVWSRYLRSPS